MSEDLAHNIFDRGYQLFIVQLVFVLLAGISTLTRVYVKYCVVKKVMLDDYLIFVAMIAYTVYAALSIDGIVNGATGKHPSLIETPDQAVLSLRAWYLCEALYPPITLTVRASLCVFLLRLASSRAHRWIIWINLITISVISTSFFFVLLFQCSPVSYFWMQIYGAQGQCIDKKIVQVAVLVHSIFSALSDWCLGLLPIAILWKVKINKRTKVIVAALLGLGMVAGVVLIVRIPYISHIKPSVEFLYATIDIAICSVMEPALGIIAACVATFRPLFKEWGIWVEL